MTGNRNRFLVRSCRARCNRPFLTGPYACFAGTPCGHEYLPAGSWGVAWRVVLAQDRAAPGKAGSQSHRDRSARDGTRPYFGESGVARDVARARRAGSWMSSPSPWCSWATVVAESSSAKRAEHRPERIRLLVYLTAFLPSNGESLFDLCCARGGGRSFRPIW